MSQSDDGSAESKSRAPRYGRAPPHCAQLLTAGIYANSALAVIDSQATKPSEAGLAYVELTQIHAPTRRVNRSKWNSMVRFPSAKMGFVLEGESDTIEGALLHELEMAPEVRSMYTQAYPVELIYERNGRKVRTSYTPDILVEFWDDRVAVVEGKLSQDLKEQISEGNPRSAYDEQTCLFVDPIAKAKLAEIGISHVTITDVQINYTLIGSISFLGAGYLYKWQPNEGTNRFLQFIREQRVVFLQNCLKSNSWTSDDVYGAIANRLVYVDISRFDLRFQHESIPVYSSHETFLAFEFQMTGQTVDDQTAPTLISNLLSATSDWSPASTRHALDILTRIRPAIEDDDAYKKLSKTYQKHCRNLRLAIKEGRGLDCLHLKFADRGPHDTQKMDPQVYPLMLQAIQGILAPHLPNAVAGYGWLVDRCAELKITAPSKVTYYKYLHIEKSKQSNSELASVEGSKVAYQKLPAEPLGPAVMARKASRAFDEGQFDHTPLALETISPIAGIPLGKAWLTRLKDRHTRETLGAYLAYHRPRSDSCQAVIWDCYRRHGRVPEKFSVDGEKPHDSVSVEQVFGELEATKIGRRYGCPRDGADIESGFSAYEKEFLCHLPGNYVNSPKPSLIDPEISPKALAEWSPARLFMAINEYEFNFKNRRSPVPGFGGLTPERIRDLSWAAHGARGFRVSDDRFKAASIILPHAGRAGLRVLTERHTIRHAYQTYVPATPLQGLLPTSLPVRYDPFDITYILVFLDGQWRPFLHQSAERFSQIRSSDPVLLAAITTETIQLARMAEAATGEKARQLSRILSAVNELPRDPLSNFLANSEPAKAKDSSKLEVDPGRPARVLKFSRA